MSDNTDPIAVLHVSAPRRYFVLAIQVGLGAMLIFVAFTLPERAPVIQVVLIALGALLLWRSRSMYMATQNAIIFDESGLRDTSGRIICTLEDIASVDRGTFAFKPSNGFLVRLKTKGERAWVPGLWWRVGNRVGIGGATSGKAARDMADVISLMLTEQGAELIAAARQD